jgi:hypothetical protein
MAGPKRQRWRRPSKGHTYYNKKAALLSYKTALSINPALELAKEGIKSIN